MGTKKWHFKAGRLQKWTQKAMQTAKEKRSPQQTRVSPPQGKSLIQVTTFN